MPVIKEVYNTKLDPIYDQCLSNYQCENPSTYYLDGTVNEQTENNFFQETMPEESVQQSLKKEIFTNFSKAKTTLNNTTN